MAKANTQQLNYYQILIEFIRNFNHFSLKVSLSDVVKVILYDIITLFSPGA